ncbi:ferrochelatase, partial [Pseudomonas sp. MWU12-2534b]
CLETLEEIAMEGKHSFQSSGGGEFRYISCLNDNPQWIAALAGIVGKNLQGWQEVIEQDTAQRQQRAQSLGAKS